MTLSQRQLMIDQQIAARGVADPQVLAAMLAVDRELFVPPAFKKAAYADEPLPIGYGQTISQPYIVAYMTEALRLKPGDRVLEVGTGCGYQAAILAQIAKEVYTIEVVEPLAAQAAERLRALGIANIDVACRDGYGGWPEKAPFDAIMVTAAPPEVPKELAAQLVPGGRMIVPVGSFFQELVLVTRNKAGFDAKPLLAVRFVPMVRPERR